VGLACVCVCMCVCVCVCVCVCERERERERERPRLRTAPRGRLRPCAQRCPPPRAARSTPAARGSPCPARSSSTTSRTCARPDVKVVRLTSKWSDCFKTCSILPPPEGWWVASRGRAARAQASCPGVVRRIVPRTAHPNPAQRRAHAGARGRTRGARGPREEGKEVCAGSGV